MNFHFLHAADIHLDSPLRGLTAYAGAPVAQFREATRVALQNLVDQALAMPAAFVVIAGDLYDGDWPDFATGLFLVNELERLNRAGIRAVILYGNHDAASRITRSLPLPANTYHFDHQQPQTILFDDLGVALHGQSFAQEKVETNLVNDYPAAIPGYVNIGVLHTALEGDARHARYAPCSVEQLCGFGYDYWALGHVHRYAIINEAPWLVFPGNLQGRHIRETGAKGCVAVTVRDGQVAGVDRLILDVVRWLEVEVDVSDCTDRDAVQARCSELLQTAIAARAENRPAAVRVCLQGQTPAHAQLAADYAGLEAALQATMLGWPDCWLERVRLATAPPAMAPATAPQEAGDLLADLLAAADTDPELAEQLRQSLAPVLNKLPRELLTSDDADWAEDFPLITALRAGDYSALVQAVLPDLYALQGASS